MNIVREFIPAGYKPVWWKELEANEPDRETALACNGPIELSQIIVAPQVINNRRRRMIYGVEFYVIAGISDIVNKDNAQKVVLGHLEQIISKSMRVATGITTKPWTVYTTFRYAPEFCEAFTDRVEDLPPDPQVIGKYSVLVAEAGMQLGLVSDLILDPEQVTRLQRDEPDYLTSAGWVHENGNLIHADGTRFTHDCDGSISLYVPGNLTIGAKGGIALGPAN